MRKEQQQAAVNWRISKIFPAKKRHKTEDNIFQLCICTPVFSNLPVYDIFNMCIFTIIFSSSGILYFCMPVTDGAVDNQQRALEQEHTEMIRFENVATLLCNWYCIVYVISFALILFQLTQLIFIVNITINTWPTNLQLFQSMQNLLVLMWT